MDVLRSVSAGHDFVTALFPDAPHPLFDQSGFPPDLFEIAGDWLAKHALV
jgi:hypothetical protein